MKTENEPIEQTIERATRALRAEPVQVDDVRRARLWANVKAARPARRAWWPTWTFAGPAVAAALLFLVGLWLWRSPVDDVRVEPAVAEHTAPVPVPVRREFVSGDGRITLDDAALVEHIELSPLRLVRGQAKLSLPQLPPPLAPVLLGTPVASIRLLAGSALVTASEDVTTVEVLSGRALVTANGIDQTVLGGTTLEVRPEVETAAVAPPVAKPSSRITKPKPRAVVPNDDEEVTRARRLVRRDAPTAERVAKAVLDRRPAPRIEARALMVLADVERLQERPAAAEKLYRRVLDLPEGRDFFEEAFMRRAELLVNMGRHDDAMRALTEAEGRVGAGPLAPERRALEVRLLLRTDPHRAAARLDNSEALQGVAMTRIRIDVAEALVDTAPKRAAKLAKEVVDAGASSRWTKRARAILARAGKKVNRFESGRQPMGTHDLFREELFK